MNTAVPVLNNQLAKHFAKAKAWHIFDAQHQRIATLAIDISDGCQARKQLMHTLAEHQVQTIKVRMIGQCMLGKLLKHGFSVQQLTQAALPAAAAEVSGVALLAAEQGRVSKHRCSKTHACGGQCQHD